MRPRPREAPAIVRSRPGRRAPARPPGERHRHCDRHPETGGEAPSSVGGFVRAERGPRAARRRRAASRAPPAGRAGPARRTTTSGPTARRPRPRAPRRSGGPSAGPRRGTSGWRPRGGAGQHHLLGDRGAGEREPGHPAQRRRGGARRQRSAERRRPVARHQLVEEPAGRATGTKGGPRRRSPRGRPGTGSPPPRSPARRRTPRSPGACPRARRCDPAGDGRRVRPARRPRSLVALPGCARPSGTSGEGAAPADSMNRRN